MQIRHLPRGACDLEEEIGIPLTCDLEEESRNLGGRKHFGPGGRNWRKKSLRTWRTKLHSIRTSDLGEEIGRKKSLRTWDEIT